MIDERVQKILQRYDLHRAALISSRFPVTPFASLLQRLVLQERTAPDNDRAALIRPETPPVETEEEAGMEVEDDADRDRGTDRSSLPGGGGGESRQEDPQPSLPPPADSAMPAVDVAASSTSSSTPRAFREADVDATAQVTWSCPVCLLQVPVSRAACDARLSSEGPDDGSICDGVRPDPASH